MHVCKGGFQSGIQKLMQPQLDLISILFKLPNYKGSQWHDHELFVKMSSETVNIEVSWIKTNPLHKKAIDATEEEVKETRRTQDVLFKMPVNEEVNGKGK